MKEPRELTADDVVADVLYFLDAPGGAHLKPKISDVYASDRYTVVIELTGLDIMVNYYLGYEDRSLIEPPETRAAGADQWKNQIGTGPFMLTDWSLGSYFSYDRNPIWWKTTTIDGVEYEIPFIDKLVMPIIPDVSTQVAALRTGKLDLWATEGGVPPAYWDNLEETAPGLVKSLVFGTVGSIYHFKCDEPPFNDVEVRRAMAIGTDRDALAALHAAGSLPKHWFPLYCKNPFVFTPMEELPEGTQLLYDYNPELAKQMLADAGYPNGFKTYIYDATTPMGQDRSALLKSQWAKIGVDAEIKVMDSAGLTNALREHNYDGVIADGPKTGNSLFVLALGEGGNYFNCSWWSDDYYNEQMAKAGSELDDTKRNAMIKELGVILLSEVPVLPTATSPSGNFWWPWIKNYYGEICVGDTDSMTPMAYAWVDQALKEEMGY